MFDKNASIIYLLLAEIQVLIHRRDAESAEYEKIIKFSAPSALRGKL